MMSVIIPLFAALAELFASGKSIAEIASLFQINIHDLTHAYGAVRGNLWKGQFARALQAPDQRPDLQTHFAQLAALEHHYGLLMTQLQRAEETCRQVRAQEKTDLKQQMKADSFAFRVEQAAAKILRDMQKERAALQKTIATPYTTFSAETFEEPRPQMPSQLDQAIEPKPVQPTTTHQSQAPAQDFAVTMHEPQAAELPPPPSPEEFRNLLFKHRERIKNTPAKDRPTLIARLMEQEKNKPIAA